MYTGERNYHSFINVITNTNPETVKNVGIVVSIIIHIRDNLCFVLVLIQWLFVYFDYYTCTCKTQLFILYDLYILCMYFGPEELELVMH